MNTSTPSAPTAPSAGTPPTGAPPSGNARKALLVDDDSFQLDLMLQSLHSLGLLDVTQASSGTQALQLAQQQRFHLIVLDLHMPGMDGFQFMEALAQGGFTGALVIVSGQSDSVMRAASLVAQVRRFTLLGAVSKPVGRSALQALLAKLA